MRPLKNGLLRTLNWAGFHAAIVIAAARRTGLPARVPAERRRWLVWLLISLAGVAAGFRFFPRYYFQLLPVVVLLAARGFAEMRGRRQTGSAPPADSPGALCAHLFHGGAR